MIVVTVTVSLMSAIPMICSYHGISNAQKPLKCFSDAVKILVDEVDDYIGWKSHEERSDLLLIIF